VTAPAAWTIRAESQADAIGPYASATDTSGDSGFDGFNFGGFGGPHTLKGTLQEPLFSESQLGGTGLRLSSVRFCYFVGPIVAGATDTRTTLDHAWIYAVSESGSGSKFPAPRDTLLAGRAISGVANDSGGCMTVTLPTPVTVPPASWLEFRVEASDDQTDPTSSGALVQLGGVTANFTQ
jgi:hypothetical protein